jgi:hypothetical protein
MKSKLLAMTLLAAGSVFAQTGFSANLGFEGGSRYAPPAPAYIARGPDFVWVDGFWSFEHGRRVWVPGRWDRRPIERFRDRDRDRFDRDRFDRDQFRFRR